MRYPEVVLSDLKKNPGLSFAAPIPSKLSVLVEKVVVINMNYGICIALVFWKTM